MKCMKTYEKSLARWPLLFGAFLLFLLTNKPACAQVSDEADVVYVGNRMMLTAGHPRQLTLNAHINDFTWSTDGRHIAYLTMIGTYGQGGTETSIAVVDTLTGRVHDYADEQEPFPIPPDAVRPAQITSMTNWSPSGRYFAFADLGHGPSASPNGEGTAWLVDVSAGTLKQIPLPENAVGIQFGDSLRHNAWSTDKDLLAMNVTYGKFMLGHALIYNPMTNVVTEPLPDVEARILSGWTDANHLLLWLDRGMGSYNVELGKIDDNPWWEKPLFHNPFALTQVTAGEAGTVRLSLTSDPKAQYVDTVLLRPVRDENGRVRGMVAHLWVTVMPDKSAVLPLAPTPKTKTAPLKLLVDVYRTPPANGFSNIQFAPDRHGPSGSVQIAYLISGDLYVSTITSRAASVLDLLAFGVSLTCPEEQQLAQLNEAQISSGISSYLNANANQMPAAKDFPDALYKHGCDKQAFRVGQDSFEYLMDHTDVSQIDMDDRANNRVGYFDLPCGRVVLYLDGHVETLDRFGRPITPKEH